MEGRRGLPRPSHSLRRTRQGHCQNWYQSRRHLAHVTCWLTCPKRSARSSRLRRRRSDAWVSRSVFPAPSSASSVAARPGTQFPLGSARREQGNTQSSASRLRTGKNSSYADAAENGVVPIPLVAATTNRRSSAYFQDRFSDRSAPPNILNGIGRRTEMLARPPHSWSGLGGSVLIVRSIVVRTLFGG